MASAVGRSYRRATKLSKFKNGFWGRGVKITTRGIRNLGRLMTLIFVGRL